MPNLLRLVLVAALLLGACAQRGGPPAAGSLEGGVVTLAKVEGWRSELQIDQVPFGLVEVVFDRPAADRAWAENVPENLARREGEPREPGIYGDLDRVDFDSHVVVVWASGESGTCPGWLSDVTFGADGEVDLKTSTHAPGEACTDDYRFYRMVLAVERDLLPGRDDLPADATVNGALDGRVVAYPYSEQ